MRRLDLEDEALEGDCVVVTDGAFLFNRENQIKIDVSLDWDKSRSWLLRFDSESLVELVDVSLLQEKIGGLFCFDAVQTKFVAKSALKSFVDAFAATACFGRVGRDHSDI